MHDEPERLQIFLEIIHVPFKRVKLPKWRTANCCQ